MTPSAVVTVRKLNYGNPRGAPSAAELHDRDAVAAFAWAAEVVFRYVGQPLAKLLHLAAQYALPRPWITVTTSYPAQ